MNTNNSSILIVEDAFLVGIQLKEDIESLGYNGIGPANSIEKALTLISENNINGALLDVNLGHETSIPIADKLSNMSVPFLFITGYESVSIEHDLYKNYTLIRKPILLPDIEEAIKVLSI